MEKSIIIGDIHHLIVIIQITWGTLKDKLVRLIQESLVDKSTELMFLLSITQIINSGGI